MANQINRGLLILVGLRLFADYKIAQDYSKDIFMICNFKLFNNNGVKIPVDIEYPISYFKNVDNKVFGEYYDGSKKGISWEYMDEEITIKDSVKSLIGFPTVDLKYVVVIYSGSDRQGHPYNSPNNAVIFNLNGTVHKRLEIPKLEATTIVNRIKYFNEANPPLEAANYEGGLLFDSFSWHENGVGLVNQIRIIYDREWIEFRELIPETGEIGKLLGSGKL